MSNSSRTSTARPVIREVREDDLPVLVDIASETLEHHVRASGGDPSLFTVDFLRSTLRETRVLVAEVDGEVVGYLQYQLKPPKIIFNGAAFRPAWQRRGFGSKLFAHAVSNAHAANCSTVIISVQPSNEEVYMLYQRLGFAEGENPSGWNREMSMSMEKVLEFLGKRQ